MEILGIDHVGIRVSDEAAAVDFYAKLGFEVAARFAAQAVVILRSAGGTELNLIVNAVPAPDGENVLMDVPDKHPGHTHFALQGQSIEDTVTTPTGRGIELSGGPVPLGDGVSIFVRDPDRSVIELRQVGVLQATQA